MGPTTHDRYPQPRRPRPPVDTTRRSRIAVLAGVAVVAAVVLAVIGRGGTGHTGQATPTTPADNPARGSSASSPGPTASTSPTTPPTTAVPAAVVWAVQTGSTVVSARTASGATVTVPTALWVPTGASSGPFPLLVFSPGYQIDPSAYAPLTSAWAADGYIVAEPTYPDTAPGAPLIESDMVNHPAELTQVITALLSDSSQGALPAHDTIEPAQIAVAGQSDGGDVSLAAVANSCCRDPRIKAAVILSGAEATLFGGTYYSTGSTPLLAVQGSDDPINPPGCSEQLYDGAPAPRYYLSLPGATHLSAYTAAGPQLSVVVDVTTAFLDGYVKRIPSRLDELPQIGTQTDISQLSSGSATVTVEGSCLGAPA